MTREIESEGFICWLLLKMEGSHELRNEGSLPKLKKAGILLFPWSLPKEFSPADTFSEIP